VQTLEISRQHRLYCHPGVLVLAAAWARTGLTQTQTQQRLRAVHAHDGDAHGMRSLLLVQGLIKMRAACKLAAEVLNYAGTLVQPGVTTDEIDRAVHDMAVARGAYPSPLNYGKFPKSVCTSVNEVMCHGIPDSRWALCSACALRAEHCSAMSAAHPVK
jgi:Xaa-Pro aminopeptidase